MKSLKKYMKSRQVGNCPSVVQLQVSIAPRRHWVGTKMDDIVLDFNSMENKYYAMNKIWTKTAGD